MKITDGNKTVNLIMKVWNESTNSWSPDWSPDFLNMGELSYDEEQEAVIVWDVDYCIQQAMDWKNSVGDFRDDVPNNNNEVFVEVV